MWRNIRIKTLTDTSTGNYDYLTWKFNGTLNSTQHRFSVNHSHSQVTKSILFNWTLLFLEDNFPARDELLTSQSPLVVFFHHFFSDTERHSDIQPKKLNDVMQKIKKPVFRKRLKKVSDYVICMKFSASVIPTNFSLQVHSTCLHENATLNFPTDFFNRTFLHFSNHHLHFSPIQTTNKIETKSTESSAVFHCCRKEQLPFWL